MQPINPQQRSYTNVVQSDYFPKKDQAIITEAEDGIQIKDYVYALSKITTSTNIRFILWISNNRTCVFMASKKIADDMDQHKHILVDDTKLAVKSLISKS